MSILLALANRLRKGDWDYLGAQALAEEIISGLEAKVPVELDGPVKITGPDDGRPPLQLVTNQTINNTQVPPITVENGPFRVPDIPQSPGVTPFTPDGSSSSGGNAFDGTVLSGSGTTYSCALLPGGLVVTVTMRNLSPDADLPAGIRVPVIKSGNVYYGYPPVFLGP